MRARPEALLALLALGVTSVAGLAACSASDAEAPLVEYPTGPEASDPATADAAPPSADAARDAGPDAPEPIVGTKLLAEPVILEDVTSDGHLVFSTFSDLKVWPAGAPAPVTVVKDYDAELDSFTVRGRLVFAWLGESASPSAVTTWTLASGLKTGGAVARRLAVYPKPSADTFAYLGPATNVLSAKVWVTTPGQGAGTSIVAQLDSGLAEQQCKPTVTWAGSDLLVAGCTGGSTTPRVATYATDGSGTSTSVLEGSAPGLWLNRARSHALVQTSSASSLRALTGAATPLPLDTPVVRAVFASDDTKVVYLRADGQARRAATKPPLAPVDLGPAKELLGISPDARFTVLATVVDASSRRSDLVVVDANAPATRRQVAPEKAIFHGITSDGASFVYQLTTGLGAEGPLFIGALAGGAPQKIADAAQRVVFDGGVVYWQEYLMGPKTNVLKAVRISSTQAVVALDQGLDPLTAFAVRAGPKLFVGSKLGLWSYPALSP